MEVWNNISAEVFWLWLMVSSMTGNTSRCVSISQLSHRALQWLCFVSWFVLSLTSCLISDNPLSTLVCFLLLLRHSLIWLICVLLSATTLFASFVSSLSFGLLCLCPYVAKEIFFSPYNMIINILYSKHHKISTKTFPATPFEFQMTPHVDATPRLKNTVLFVFYEKDFHF